MPSYDERIRGDREAVRIQKELADSLNLVGDPDKPAKDRQWRADVRQLAVCILMALAGLGFAILLMVAARY